MQLPILLPPAEESPIGSIALADTSPWTVTMPPSSSTFGRRCRSAVASDIAAYVRVLSGDTLGGVRSRTAATTAYYMVNIDQSCGTAVGDNASAAPLASLRLDAARRSLRVPECHAVEAAGGAILNRVD